MNLRSQNPQRVLVIGATSTIAEAIARRFAGQGAALCLVARNVARLQAVADDLLLRGASKAETLCADLTEFARHPALIASALERLGDIDTVLVAHGVLGDQKAGEADYGEAECVLITNFLSVVSLLTPLANYFEQRGSGCIVVISSVAGDRGRRSNYIYGSSKAGLNAFLDGLRSRLHPRGVSVITVKPGFVDTAMTAHLTKTKLFAKPEAIAHGVQRAMLSRKDVVYLPRFWAPIMLIMRLLPRFIFKRITV